GCAAGRHLQPVRRRPRRADCAARRRRLWAAFATVGHRRPMVLLLRRHRADRRQPDSQMNSPANDLVALLQQLIRIPSPNPPGDCRDIAEFCAAYLRDAGFATTLVAPDDRAWSVVGILGEADTPSLLYHAHIDTVPLGQNARWSVDPFAGMVADGRIYGLGSVDDKAPLAAMLLAAADIGARAERVRGRLVVVCAAEEEVGGR